MGDNNENITNPVDSGATAPTDGRDEILKSISDLKIAQDGLISAVGTLCEEKQNQDKNFLDIVGKIDNMSKKIEDLSSECKILDTKFARLEPEASEPKVSRSDPTNAVPTVYYFAEMNDRLVRSRNLIFYHVPEDHLQKDMHTVVKIIRLMGSELIPICALRIGRVSDQCRPIRVVFKCPEDIYSLLKIKYKLRNTKDFKQVSITSDRTRFERSYLKIVIEEINSRKASGEKNLILKYRFNVPYIYKTDSKNGKF